MKTTPTHRIGQALYAELIAGHSVFDWCFLATGLLIQVVIFHIHPESALSIVSALAGACSVVLCSQKKISMYFFGFIQVVTYLVIAYEQRLWAEVAENIYYFITMIWGVFLWMKNYRQRSDNQSTELQTHHLSAVVWGITFLSVAVGSGLVGYALATFTNDTQPYLDALTTVPAIVAQILMIKGYREQWIFWFLIDVGLTVLWLRADNWCLVAQHIFWLANTIYGFIKWSPNKNN